MKLRTKFKILFGAVALGGLVAYLFDPAEGERRRERLTQAVEHRVSDLRDTGAKADRVVEAVAEPSDEPEVEPADGPGSTEPAAAESA